MSTPSVSLLIPTKRDGQGRRLTIPVTRDIVGLKKEESDAILKFLYDHLAYGADFQARVKWEEGTVVVWDNRVTQHSALIDWKNGQRRHLGRITPQAERPFETAYAKA